jgi:hypothetical protein
MTDIRAASPESQEPSAATIIGQFDSDPSSNIEQKRDTYKEQYDRSLTEIELKDLHWVVQERPNILKYFKWLLGAQNAVVFGLVLLALGMGELSQLQIVFSVLVAATLTETAFAVRIMVTFLFQKITYENRFDGKRGGKK